jgi:hypothetical protein
MGLLLVLVVGCASTVSENNAPDSSPNCRLPNGTTCLRGARCESPIPNADCVCHVDGVLDCSPLLDSGVRPDVPATMLDAGMMQDVPTAPSDTSETSDRPATRPDAGVFCALPGGVPCPAGVSCSLGDGCNHCQCSASGVLQCTALICEAADAGTCGAPGSVCERDDQCCSGSCPPMGAPVWHCESARPINCYDRACNAATEYCELTYRDVPVPDSSNCRPLPTACHGTASCGCVSHPCGLCEERTAGVVGFRCPGL